MEKKRSSLKHLDGFTSHFFFLSVLSFILFSTVLESKEVRRVIGLTPSVCEIIETLSPGKLVGKVDYADYPLSIKSLPSVGTYHRPNEEEILKLKPDLVVAASDGNPLELIQRLEKRGVRVLRLEGSGLNDYLLHLQALGSALGAKPSSDALTKEFQQQIDLLKKQKSRCKNRSTLALLLNESPLLVLGGKSFLSEAFHLAGNENIFSDQKSSYQRVQLEALLLRKPNKIFYFQMLPSEVERKALQERLRSRFLAPVTVPVTVIEDDRLLRLGPRFFQAFTEFYKKQGSTDLCL